MLSSIGQTNHPIINKQIEQRDNNHIRNLYDVSTQEVLRQRVELWILLLEEDTALLSEGQGHWHQGLHEEVHADEEEVPRYGAPVSWLGVTLPADVEVEAASENSDEKDLDDSALHHDWVSQDVEEISL